MKSSIALIGFMGTGKTAVGKVLAEKLGKKIAVSTDEVSAGLAKLL
jgi:shikimate kinase